MTYRRGTTDPRAQVHPAFQFARFEFNLAGNGERTIQVAQLDPFPAAFQNWLLGSWNVLNFLISSNGFGGILRLDLSWDGNAGVDQVHAFPLTGEGVADSLTGFELSGFSSKFVIRNGNYGAAVYKGWIQVRSF